MTLRVVTEPTRQLLDLAVVKQHLHVDHADEDATIDSLIRAVTGQLEAATQRRFVTQVLEWVLPWWPCKFRLPVAPVATGGVEFIKYRDASNVLQTLDPSLYVAAPDGPTLTIRPVFGQTWPQLSPDAIEAVVVRFTAGTDPVGAGDDVLNAAKVQIKHLYDTRGAAPVEKAASGLSETAEALVGSARWI